MSMRNNFPPREHEGITLPQALSEQVASLQAELSSKRAEAAEVPELRAEAELLRHKLEEAAQVGAGLAHRV